MQKKNLKIKKIIKKAALKRKVLYDKDILISIQKGNQNITCN